MERNIGAYECPDTSNIGIISRCGGECHNAETCHAGFVDIYRRWRGYRCANRSDFLFDVFIGQSRRQYKGVVRGGIGSTECKTAGGPADKGGLFGVGRKYFQTEELQRLKRGRKAHSR